MLEYEERTTSLDIGRLGGILVKRSFCAISLIVVLLSTICLAGCGTRRGTWTNTGGGMATSSGIYSLTYDSAHKLLYAGTSNNWVWKYDGSTWTATDTQRGALSTFGVVSLVYDSAHGLLYAAAGDHGVYRYDGKEWTQIGAPPYSKRSLAQGLATTGASLYVGMNLETSSYCGVLKYDGSTWTDTGRSAADYSIQSLAYDSSHNLLYAATGRGLWKYDGTTWVNTGGDLSSQAIDSLAYDSAHNLLYAGTGGPKGKGVWKYDGHTWTDTVGSVSNDIVESLAYDSIHNLLYAGCVDTARSNAKGVWEYDGTKWSATNAGLPKYFLVYSLAYDSSHNLLYAGTTEHHGVWSQKCL